MEEEFEEFVTKQFVDEGLDLEYEFDAPQFCDFTRSETYWEAAEAEQWFESADSYPPSPFILKFRREITPIEILNGSNDYGDARSLNVIDGDSGHCMEPEVSAVGDDGRGLEFYNHTIQDSLEVKTKPVSKSTRSSSTLMKPTACHLAKQKNPPEVHTTRFFRCQSYPTSHFLGDGGCPHILCFIRYLPRFLSRCTNFLPKIGLSLFFFKKKKKKNLSCNLALLCFKQSCNIVGHGILELICLLLDFYNNSLTFSLFPINSGYATFLFSFPWPFISSIVLKQSRFQNQNSSPIDGQAAKRQKLEAGYSGKASHLKHQALLTHKTPKKVDLTHVKLAPRATIPRQPELETALRAQRHKFRSRINAEAGGHTTSSSYMFKARPLNRKILETPSLPFSKKRAPQLPEFHVFCLKTSERAMHHASSNAGGIINCNTSSDSETRDLRRPNSTDASRQMNCRMVNKLRGSPHDKRLSSKGERGVFENIRQENMFSMELKFTNDKRLPNEPPTELFGKLSLASEAKQTTKSRLKEQPTSKGLKENRPGSLDQMHESINLVKEGTHRLWGKQYQFVNNHGIPDLKSHLHVDRRMNIC